MARPAVFIAAKNGVYSFELREALDARASLLALGLSRPTAAAVFAESRLASAGVFLQPHMRLEAGSPLELVARRDEPLSRCVPVDLEVLYEDPFVLAVNKPAGLLVHGDGTGTPTLSDRVAAYLQACGEHFAPQAVQRLDVETTGVVLFSKTAEFQPLFDALVAGHDMRKRYLAVVRGVPGFGRAVFEDAIARDRHDARRMRATATGGQAACTEVELLATDAAGKHALVAAVLGTGRKHQIRVHLSAHGHAIVNDPLYGVAETPGGLMLHAYEERFEHPVTGELVNVCAGWPQRFSAWFSPRDVQGGGKPLVRRASKRKAGPHGAAR